MMKMFRQSLPHKIALSVGLSCLGITALGFVWMTQLIDRDIAEQTRQSLLLFSDSLLASFSAPNPQSGPHSLSEWVEGVASRQEGLKVRIFDRSGKIAFSHDAGERYKSVEKELLQRTLANPLTYRLSQDRARVEVLRQVRAKPACLSCHGKSGPLQPGELLGGIQVESSYAHLRHKAGAYGLLQIISALLLALLAAALTLMFLRIFLLSPLQKITRALEAAREGDFTGRVEPTGTDEIGRVSALLNELLGKLIDLNAHSIDARRELREVKGELRQKAELEKKNRIIEESNRQMTRRFHNLDLLYNFNRSLTSTLDLSQITRVLTQHMTTAFGFPDCSLVLYEDGPKKLRLAAAAGRHAREGMEETLLEIRPGRFAEAVHRGEPVLIRKLGSVVRDDLDELLTPGTGSFLAIPLTYKSRTLGLLCFSRPENDAFSQDDIQLLTSVTQQSAMAILNAQLYQEKLSLSVTDELTKLANRRQMQFRLETEYTRATRMRTPLSVLMVDIDHFKCYNDINGHLLGDKVVQSVAQILQENTRKMDTVARFGGEEFVVILPDQDKTSAAAVADKLRRAVNLTNFPRAFRQPGGRVTISVGVASLPDDAADPFGLLNKSDLALYAAKGAGRDCTIAYENGMDQLSAGHRVVNQDAPKVRRSGKSRP